MRWLSCFIFLAVTGLAGTLFARPGVVRTLDGRTLGGELHLTNGLLIVTATNAEWSAVALTNLLSATFQESIDVAGDTPPGRGLGLLGHYFANTNLTDNVVIRLDETIDFDWGTGEPAPGVPADGFSVAWTGEVEAPASGSFTFAISADEGARLFFEDNLIAEVRTRNGAEVPSSPVTFEAGRKYRLKLTTYDRTGSALARLWWTGPRLAKSIVPKSRLYPKSGLPEHTSDISTNAGLLATYYQDAEFGGRTFTRVDPGLDFNWTDRDPAPGFSRTNVSIRWSGQVLAGHTEEYTFYTLSDERVRLWVDRKPLIDRPEQTWLMENKEGIALVAGDKYDLRFETQSRSGGAVARLLWSSASVEKTNVPATHLFPSRPTLARDSAIESGDKLPPGLVLRSGAFIGCPVEKATETSIRAAGLLKNVSISTVNVARILCQPLSKAMAERIVSGRPGVLLSKGDFVDGDFRGLENGRVRISSVLFGLRSYDAKREVLAVSLREPGRVAGAIELRLRDQTLLQSGAIRLEPDRVVVQEAALGPLRIAVGELDSIRQPGRGTSLD